MKDSITTKEFVTLLSKMKGNADNRTVMKELDPEYSEEYGHYLRVQAGKRANDYLAPDAKPMTLQSIVAELLEEEIMNNEKVSIANAIELLQWAEFNRGAEHIKNTEQSSRENVLPSKLQELLLKLKESGVNVHVVDLKKEKE